MDATGLQRRWAKLASGNPRARNYWIVDGVFTEDDPQATYNSDGSLALDGLQRVTRFFQSGGGPFTVTSAEATMITTAGFGAYLS